MGVGSHTVSLADVGQWVDGSRPFSYTSVTQYEKASRKHERKVICLDLTRRREVWADGRIHIFDLSSAKHIELIPDRKVAVETTYLGKMPSRNFDLLDCLSRLQTRKNADRGTQQLDGQKARVFHADSENNRLTAWVNPSNGLPIRVEVVHPKHGRTITMKDFDFEIAPKEELFSTVAPPGSGECSTLRQTHQQRHTDSSLMK